MFRLALAFAALVVTALPAAAQHYRGGSFGGHYHVQPGHYDWHNGHYDYHPGQSIYHPNRPSSSYYYAPRSRYVQPLPIYRDPSDGHAYDHQTIGGDPHGAAYRGTFGGFSHIDDLAVQLEREANLMCLEMHYNYQHNRGFRETYREAYEIYTTAKYIHGLEHAGNRDKIRQAVTELDPLFHHVQEDVRHWTRHSHRPIGHGGLSSKLVAVEESLHHLMNDVGATSQFENGAETDEVAPPADHDLPLPGLPTQ